MLLDSMAMPLLRVAEVVLGIGLLIFLHELGHFLVGKWMGVRVLKFSLGFGRRLIGFRRGETEYVISVLPLGGYVKFAGENPGEQSTPDPRALVNQPAWRRALIYSSGVVMNVAGALAMFIAAFGIGVRFTVPRVGQVRGPAYEAGVLPGDEIVEVAGRRDLDFEDVRVIVALSRPGSDLPIVVRRDGRLLRFTVQPRMDARLGRGFPTIGIAPPISTRIAAVQPGSPADEAGIRKGERILAVRVGSGPMRAVETFDQLRSLLRDVSDTPVVLEIEGLDGRRRCQVLRLRGRPFWRLPWRLGRPRIFSLQRGGPAERAGLKPGDLVLAADGHDPVDLHSLVEIISSRGRAGLPVRLRVRRGDRERVFSVLPRPEGADGKPRIGVSLGVPPEAQPMVVWVEEGSSLDRAGVPVGALVLGVNGRVCRTVAQVNAALRDYLGFNPPLRGKTIRLELRTPDGTEMFKEVTAEAKPNYELGIAGEYETRLRRYRNVLKACAVGWRKTVISIRRVLLTLRRIIFTRTVSPDNVAGPVQIPVMAYKYAELGPGDFLYFLAILGANLAVINLLPIPILDGGQLLLLGVEKVKGSRLSERAQAIAQYIGLAVILMVFLYILLQDVGKLMGVTP